MAMKTSEAVYWLMTLAKEIEQQLAHAQEREEAEQLLNTKTGEAEPSSQEQHERWLKWHQQHMQEMRQKIEALEIAAASMTRR